LIQVRAWTDARCREWVSLQVNPARVVDPEGWGLASLPQAQEALEWAWAHLRPLVVPRRPLESAKLSRLDVAVDFHDVLLPDRYIRNLADAPASRHGQRRLVWAGDRSDGATLYWGNGRGEVRIYDKHIETAGRAPRGTMRGETEARRKWCKKAGLGEVGDLRMERLTALMRRKWEDSGMGTPVTSLPQWMADLAADPEITDVVLRGVVGDFLTRSYGLKLSLSPGTEKTYKEITKRHGIPALVTPLADDGCPLRMRLDLESGQEVVHAAR